MTTPASPPSPAVIRGWIAAAGRAISPHFPLETFIARNPVAGYENLDWEEAIGLIARDHGILLSLPEQRFRDLYAQGRISPADLQAALRFTVPEAGAPRSLDIGGTRVTVGEILGHDLLVAPPLTRPRPNPPPPHGCRRGSTRASTTSPHAGSPHRSGAHRGRRRTTRASGWRGGA